MSDQPIRLDLANKTRNLRHRTIISKGCQYLKEIIGAGTSDSPMIDRADYKRVTDYLDDMEALTNSMPVAGAVNNQPASGRPEVDTPLTRDRFYELEVPEKVPQMNNPFWAEVAERVYNSIVEIAGSQSALFSNVLHPSDPARWKMYFDAMRYDLKVVVGAVEPMDTPSTEPVAQPVVDKEGEEWNPAGGGTGA